MNKIVAHIWTQPPSMQTKPKVKKNKTNHGSNIPCVDSLISWASLLPNPLGCCLWSFCLYKEIWMPSTVSDMSWSVFRSWVWMEYPSLLPTENLWVPFLVLIPKCQKWGRIFFHVWEVYYHPRHRYSASSSSLSSLGTAPGNNWYTDGQGALILGYQSPTDTNTTSMSLIFTQAQCYLCEASLQVWSFLLRNVPRTSWYRQIRT